MMCVTSLGPGGDSTRS